MWLVCSIDIRCICGAEISAADPRQPLKPFAEKYLKHENHDFKKKRALTKSNGVSTWLCTLNVGTEWT
ncbi:MAG TPA: hypothetical protein DEF45_17945 [Rhodopirellula sp.]|nr:hypothetical protein [Rhodopirellula sp.]